jgi:hypothetical protein
MDVTQGKRGPLSRRTKVIAFMLLPIVVVLGGTAILNQFNYSVGTRTGTIDKLSHKGVACWTNEGQLALRNFARPSDLRSTAERVDNTFYFSVPDSNVWKQLDAVPSGSTVTLEYQQKFFALDWPIPFFCVRRTQFEITGVRAASPGQADDTPPLRPQ